MGFIYKITNKLNGKVYIGLTTVSVEERWRGHVRDINRLERHLYKSMKKYGVENFKVEEIDRTDDFAKLGELERKYIKEYNSTDARYGYNVTHGGESNQLDGNPRARLTVEDVEDIRNIYSECKVGCKECWKIYSDRISFRAFEKVFEGTTWKSVMPEVYSEENKKKHRTLMKGSVGEKNHNAALTDNEVMEIRKYYVNHTLRECYEKYGNKFASKCSFRAIIDRTYLHLPYYSRIKKKWITGETEKRVIGKSNNIRIIGDILEIDTFDDYGKLNGTFRTDAKYEDIVRAHRWTKFSNGKICTRTKEKNAIFLHELIMRSNGKKVYYVNGNVTDVREENLTYKKL